MPYVNVPNDLSKVKTKMALNLTKRQLICFGCAAAVGIPSYLLARGSIGNTGAMFLMLAVMLPAFLLAMYEKRRAPGGKGAEKHHTGPVSAARSQALSDTKHLRPLCRTGRCEKGGCDCERQIKPAEEKPQRLKTGRPCPPSRRSPMWRCTRTGYASSPAGSTQRPWNMRTSIIPWHPPRIRLQSLAAGAHFSTTLTAPCRSSFPLSTAAPTPGAAIR